MPIASILAIIQALAPAIMQYGPQLIADITAILHKDNVTPNDWDALKAKYAQPDPPDTSPSPE